jgi:hypothetical protein
LKYIENTCEEINFRYIIDRIRKWIILQESSDFSLYLPSSRCDFKIFLILAKILKKCRDKYFQSARSVRSARQNSTSSDLMDFRTISRFPKISKFACHLAWNYSWINLDNSELKYRQFKKRVWVFEHFPGDFFCIESMP